MNKFQFKNLKILKSTNKKFYYQQMNAQIFEQLINNLQNPETINEANNQLSNFLSDPQSVIFLFQMIESPPSQNIKEKAIIFLHTYMKKNYDSLDQQTQNDILNKLVNLTFSDEPCYSKNLFPILLDCINDDVNKIANILPIIDQCFANNINVVTAMEVLSEVITAFDKDTSIILNNHEKFYHYSLVGLQSNNWELINPAILIFLYTKYAVLNASGPQPTQIEPHYDLIINLGKDPNLYQQGSYFCKYWSIIGDSIAKNMMPAEKIGELYDFIIAFSSNDNIPCDYRIVPLRSLVGAVGNLDFERFSLVLNLVFTLSITYVERENRIPTEYFDLIEKSLVTLPVKDVYKMLKDRMVQLHSLNNPKAEVVSIVIYSLIFDLAPEIAFADVDSIISDLMSALDRNDELLSMAVCIVLCTFQDSFHFIDVYAPPFLPKIVPFIVSPNNELRQQANNALGTLCDIISAPVPNFFEALWSFKDSIPSTEIDTYLDHLSSSIQKSVNFTDDKANEVVKFVLPFLSNPDVEISSNFLTVVGTLVSIDEALVSELLPPSMNVIMNCFNSPDSSDSAEKQCLYFIVKIYESYGDKFNEQFKPAVQTVLNLLSADENEADEGNGNAIPLSIRSAALDTCCTVAQATSDVELASKLQESCVTCFTEDYENQILNDEEEEVEEADIDELINEVEFNSISEGSKACCKIVKLLNNEDKKQLFYNIFEYTMKTNSARCASESMKPICKLLHCSSDEDRPFYLNKCGQMLEQIINNTFNALEGKEVFSGQVDMFLMTNIAFLISEVVRYPSPIIETLCQFMINIIKSYEDTSYLYSFIGAYSDVIKFKTGSQQAIQAIINLIPNLLQIAKDPSTKLNLTYLLNLIVQNDPSSVQNIIQFVPTLQEWYVQGSASPNGHQIMLSNIGSAFLTFFANGMQLDFNLLNEAIAEFPPFDTHETVSMIQNMATVFTQNQVDESCIKNAVMALIKFFLLSEVDLKKRKVSPELMNVAHQMLITFANSQPQIIQEIRVEYQKNSKTKLAKLNAILPEA